MALTIATASKPVTISDSSRRRRQSRYEVTEELLREIADAGIYTPDHAFMSDGSIVVDSNYSKRLTESSNGAYMLKRRGTNVPVGVFKPADEEQTLSPPRSLSLSPKMGVIVGDGATKEHAAYVVDHGAFAGVPRTELVVLMEHNLELEEAAASGAAPGQASCGASNEASESESPRPRSPSRLGSLQEFREHMCTSEDLGSSLFATDEVHRIGLLDLRLFNLDRHLGNLLVQLHEGRYRLIPIDHGYTLPSFRCLSDAWFCWSSWKQAAAPFSSATKAYIAALTPFADIARLKRLGLRDECILTYILCTVFVKEAVEHGWVLRALAAAMQRDVCVDDSVSDFEQLVRAASHRAHFDAFEFVDADSWGSAAVLAFLDEFEELVQDYVGMYSPNP